MRSGLIYSLLLILATSLAGPAWAQPQPSAQPAPAAQAAPSVAPGIADLRLAQELLNRDFKHLEKINQERIQSLEKQITFLLAFIIFASAAAGFTGYFSARKQAEEAVEKWIDKEGTEVLKGLRADAQKKMEMRTGEAEQLIERRVLEAEERIESLVKSATEKSAKLDELIERVSSSLEEGEEANISPDEKAEIDRAAQEAEDKETSEQTFRDLELQAYSAYLGQEFEKAAEAFDVAANLEDATPTQIAEALFDKGAALSQGQKWDEAVVAYDEVVRRFGDAEETALLEPVGKALVNKGIALGRAEKTEEELAVYDEVVRRFGESKETSLLERVARALNNKGFVRLSSAKETWQSPERDNEAREFLSQALADFENSLKVDPDIPIMLGNKGYTLFLLGREDEAEPVLRQALELGGVTFRNAELEDTEMHPLPQDEAFKQLINRLWDEVSAEKNGDGDNDGENGDS